MHGLHMENCEVENVIDCTYCQAALSHFENCEVFANKVNVDNNAEYIYTAINHLQTCYRGDATCHYNYNNGIGAHNGAINRIIDYALNCDWCLNSCSVCENCKHTLYNADGTALIVTRGCFERVREYKGYLEVVVSFEDEYITYIVK